MYSFNTLLFAKQDSSLKETQVCVRWLDERRDKLHPGTDGKLFLLTVETNFGDNDQVLLLSSRKTFVTVFSPSAFAVDKMR